MSLADSSSDDLGAGRQARLTWLLFAGLVTACLVIFQDVVFDLMGQWLGSSSYHHGLFVFPYYGVAYCPEFTAVALSRDFPVKVKFGRYQVFLRLSA